ncbi:MAG: class I SAM-dependent methyltransferase [Proteobacteria bacterium]|nr:class I SAM-dependent methyltransferase [Pseudomonadota bacterium]
MPTIQEQIDQQDLSLFKTIESQSSEDDRRSFMALNSAFRQWKGGKFTFLEIGSYKGGSLQSYVADPGCTKIISMDPRPKFTQDAREKTSDYSHVTTQDMLDLLAKVPGADVKKVIPIEKGTDQMKPSELPFKPDFCFIDGEHTDTTVVRDARFCLNAMGPDCAMAFHDGDIIYLGLDMFLAELAASGRKFRAYNLPSSVFVIELGECRLSQAEPMRSWRDQNYLGYLYCLKRNDVFRTTAREYWRIAEHPAFKLPHKLGLVKVAKKIMGGGKKKK